MNIPPRPLPGTKKEKIVRLEVCSECQCVKKTSSFLCNPECRYDRDNTGPKFIAVYKVTEEFLRDEEYRGKLGV